jgi:hypothetical protein
MGVAGLVLGIVSAIGGWFPGINAIAWILGVIGIVLSAKGRSEDAKAGRPAGLATAGLVLSIIGTVFSLIGLICVSLCVSSFAAATAPLLLK